MKRGGGGGGGGGGGRNGKLETLVSLTRQRSFQILLAFTFLYLLLFTLEIPFVFISTRDSSTDSLHELATRSNNELVSEDTLAERDPPTRPLERVSENDNQQQQQGEELPKRHFNVVVSRILLNDTVLDGSSSELDESGRHAREEGKRIWAELESFSPQFSAHLKPENSSGPCPQSLSVTGPEFSARGSLMEIPCGLTLGSHVTVVGKPLEGHDSDGEEWNKESHFMVELMGLRAVDGEEPPRILHLNPRLKGDWSGKQVIEVNTCYRMQWGKSLRCDGWKSRADEDTVDGLVKCEKWIGGKHRIAAESKAAWWLNRLVGRTKSVNIDWPFPFSEGKLFVLTLSAGLEGYHVNVDGRHVTSFPYRPGFTLEDATGLSLSGDIEAHSIFAASLPSTHPSFSPYQFLELSTSWIAPAVPESGVEMFVGILSAGNHFAERMAARKSWMQHSLIKSSKVVARFFVALHPRKEVNVVLKMEAEFFGDIVIVPYLDNYDLVVLKTVAICEYGVHRVSAKYIMKGDDDTFLKVEAILNVASHVPDDISFYVGNMNYHHKPLRYGKWAVTYEEWPEEDYPPYANGPGYVLSSDIAEYIVSEFESHKLRLFKMEDVSMGMWVEKFNSTKPVRYLHSLKFCQFGCVEGYYTAHYQLPKQMLCLWDKLQSQTRPQCCNMR